MLCEPYRPGLLCSGRGTDEGDPGPVEGFLETRPRACITANVTNSASDQRGTIPTAGRSGANSGTGLSTDHLQSSKARGRIVTAFELAHRSK